jgi:predicted O-methyltransferase YrrM
MGNSLQKIKDNLRKIVDNPKRAATLFRRRLFPFEIILNCPEAYQVIGSWTFGNLRRLPLTEIFPSIEKTDVTIQRAFDRNLEVAMDYHEILALSCIVKHIGPRNILEIGTSDGNTTANLAANSPANAHITTIDLPPEWNGEMELVVPRLMVNVTARNKVGVQYMRSDHSTKITQVFCDSVKLDWGKMPLPFDMVVIDGCHYYEYVRKDTENAINHLRSGGILVWHDYGMIEDVSKVVDSVAESLKVIAIRGTTLAVGIKP